MIEFHGRELHWPDDDERLLAVNDWVMDLDAALEYVADFGVAVQAGGACGIWPVMLAKRFEMVFTFEPNADNFRCLVQNVPYNVVPKRAALAEESGSVSLARDESEKGNAGAWHTKPGNEIEAVALDDLRLGACSFLQLDVEGDELAALKGGAFLIERHRPVIMIEEKPLPHMTGSHTAAREWLESKGYRVRRRVHRDVVLTC